MLEYIEMMKPIKDEVCLVDSEGRLLMQPEVEVDTLYLPDDLDYCVVEKDGKYGYVDSMGKLVIPFQFKKAYPFSENGLAFAVADNGLGGYIDTTGKFRIEPQYETGSQFRFKMAAVSKNGVYKYIYSNGKQAVASTFKYATGLSDCGLSVVQRLDGQYAIMSTTTLEVISLHPGNVIEDFKEGARVTKFRNVKTGREALMNAAGQIVTGFYDEIRIIPYSTMHPFKRQGFWGYLDPLGKEVIPNIYLEVSEFDRGLAKVKAFDPLAENGANTFYINKKDEIVDIEEVEEKFHFLHKFVQISRSTKGVSLAEFAPNEEWSERKKKINLLK